LAEGLIALDVIALHRVTLHVRPLLVDLHPIHVATR
jgi:hypothetical protein